jgi:hypothetical protein
MDCTVAVSVAEGTVAAGVAAGEGGAALAAPDKNTEKQRVKTGARRPMPHVIRNLLEGGPGEPPTTRGAVSA